MTTRSGSLMVYLSGELIERIHKDAKEKKDKC